MESGEWSLFAAEEDGTIAGMIAIKRADNHLDQIFVANDRRSQGIGKAMLDFVKAEMPGGFWLRTHALNIDGHRFYAREGMIHTRMEPHPRFPENIVRIYAWKP